MSAHPPARPGTRLPLPHSLSVGMLEIALWSEGWISVTVKLAFMAGSSKQGKAFRASGACICVVATTLRENPVSTAAPGVSGPSAPCREMGSLRSPHTLPAQGGVQKHPAPMVHAGMGSPAPTATPLPCPPPTW